jgi:hypothetical protein
MSDKRSIVPLVKKLAYSSWLKSTIQKANACRAKVGSKRLFGYVKHKLKEYHRNLNRVAPPKEYVQPTAIGVLAYHYHRIGKEAAMPEFYNIYREQYDYPDLCNNISKRQEQNDARIKGIIEADENIEWASNELQPITSKLEEVETYGEDDGDSKEEE